MQEQQTKEFYDFGEFRLDVKNRLLWRADEPVALNLKEFEVLLFLVENAGRVVEKDALLDAVWKDTFISEGALTQNISRLRKKLEAAAGNSEKIIETLPKRGYRFLPSVKTIEAAPALVFKEQTVQRIRVEETISLPEPIEPRDFQRRANLALQNPKSAIRNPKLLWLAIVLGVAFTGAIGFAVYQNNFRKPETKPVLIAKVVPFSGLTGREDMPAFSPDGKQMAFSWNGGDSEKDLDVYVKIIGAGEPVRLTTGANDEIYPTFSPDNRQIAFVRSFPSRSEVFLVPALGGAERKICELNSEWTSVSFSPDGQTLAVVDSISAGKQSGIFLVNLQTGERRQLTAPPESFRDNTPRFSPDGASLAFLRNFGESVREVFTVQTSDGEREERQLTFDKSGIRSLAWSADGKRIVFVSFRAGNQSNLWQIPASGGEPEIIATSGKNITNLAVSPDGRTIAFTDESNDSNIWKIAPDAPARKFIHSTRADHSPQFSPDGSRVVFVSDRTGNQEIWIADADGKNQRQLTDSNGLTGSPRFSPDGKFVAFDAASENTRDIFIVSSDGGAPRRLTDSRSRSVLPAWSADGRFVYFCSDRGGDLNIWKISVAGGEAKQITKQGGFESFASPDGKVIFYSKGRGITGLWRVSVEGDEESPVPELSEAGYWRYWTVTQKGVYFVAQNPNPPYPIMFYDFSTGQAKEIVSVEKTPLWVFPGLSVFADGKTILYAQRDQNAGNIMLAELQKH